MSELCRYFSGLAQARFPFPPQPAPPRRSRKDGEAVEPSGPSAARAGAVVPP